MNLDEVFNYCEQLFGNRKLPLLLHESDTVNCLI
jgi:hypothetical protein